LPATPSGFCKTPDVARPVVEPCFGSPTLTTLVEQALRAKIRTIEAAQASLRQAHDNLIAQQGPLFPQVNGTGQFGRQQSNRRLAVSTCSMQR